MNRICLKRKEMNRQAQQTQLQTENKVPETPKSLESSTSNLQVSQVIQEPSATQSSSSTISVENNMKFEEFQKQYDELRKLYDSKRNDYDEIAKEKKRLEIQVLNNNVQYYEKEMKRLKEQVEKYQEENEDHKHKFLVAENGKKEYEATAKVKTDELKRALQQLEKEKVTAAQLKHQIIEKQKTYQRITLEMQKSNQVLSKNFEQATAKCQRLEANLKSKTGEVQNIAKANEYLQKKIAETEKIVKKNKQIFDQTNFKKTQMLEELETKLRAQNKTSRDTIEGLEFKIEEMKSQRKTQNLLIDQRIETVSCLKTQRKNELQIVRLEENNKQLKADFDDKCAIIKKMEEKLLNTYTKEEYSQLQQALEKLSKRSSEKVAQYERQIVDYQKRIEEMKAEKLYRDNRGEQNQNSSVNKEFKEILKNQLEENTKIRCQLNSKIDELYNCRSDMEDLKCKLRASADQICILKKKIRSLEKNYKIEVDVSEQNLKNEIDSLKRKIETLNNKVDNKTRQIKQKQNFIINTIIGRSKPEDVPLILSELQRIFETQYSCKLSAAHAKIEELENQLKS